MLARHRQMLLVIPLSLIASLLGPVAGARATTAYPTVAITGYASAVTEYGSVDATGSTDPAGTDYPVSMSVYLNGTLVSETLGPAGDGFVTSPVPCPQPASSKTCTLSMLYPVGLFVGTGQLVVTMTTAQGHVVSSAPAAVVASVEPPTVAVYWEQGWKSSGPLSDITSIDQGRDVELAIEGTSDWEHQVYDESIELLMDGAPVVGSPCLPKTSNCGTEYWWEAAGTPVGMHTFQGRFTLMSGEVVLSPLYEIRVDPAPGVTITSPPDGATVSGVTTITATGTIGAAGGDAVTALALWVNGKLYGDPIPCPTGDDPTTCTVTFTWDAGTLPNGSYDLDVSSQTKDNDGANSDIHVMLANPSAPPVPPANLPPAPPVPSTHRALHLTLTGPTLLQRGSSGRVSGTVSDAVTGTGVSGVPLVVVYRPVSGNASSVSVVTDTLGHFVATAASAVLVNTQVVATTASDYGSLSAATRLNVDVPVTCRTAAVPRRVEVRVTCAVRGLASGTPVTLHYAGKHLHGALVRAAKAGAVTFVLASSTRGWVSAWASTASSRSFAASHSRHYAVHLN